MTGETRTLIGFVAALVLVVGLASVAMQKESAAVGTVAVEDLPLCSTCVDGLEPSVEQCVEAGGTVQYRRSNECFSEPDVHDVCGFGVPCFSSGSGFYCRDVKDPYCHCEADSQCPENHYCQFNERSRDGKTFELILETGECMRIARDSMEPVKVLRSTQIGL